MPDKKKYYLLDGQPVEVDEQHVGGFLKANPSAIEGRAFVTPEKDTVVVEGKHVDGFLKAYPKATELYPVEKKNPIASPLQTGASPSSGVPLRNVAQPTPAQKIAPSVAVGLTPDSKNIFEQYEDMSMLSYSPDKVRASMTVRKDDPPEVRSQKIRAAKKYEDDLRIKSSEYPKVLSSINKEVDDIVKGIDVSKMTTRTVTGTEEPNDEAISEWAKEEARKRGVKDDGLFQKRLWDAARSEVSFGIVKPEVMSEAEKIYKSTTGGSLFSDMSKDAIGLQAKKKSVESDLQSYSDNIRSSASSDFNSTFSQEFGLPPKELADKRVYDAESAARQIASSMDKYAPLIQGDKFIGNEQQYAQYVAEYQAVKDQLSQLEKSYAEESAKILERTSFIANDINSRYNKQLYQKQAEATDAFNRDVRAFEEKYGKMKPQMEADYKKSVNKAYEDVMKKRGLDLENKSYALTKLLNRVAPGSGYMVQVGGQYLSSLGSGIKAISSSIGWRDGEVLGSQMSTAFNMGDAEINEVSELFSSKGLRSTGQFAGAMTTSMVPAIIAGAATFGVGATPFVSGAVASLVAFGSESMDLTGRMYDDTFSQTGGDVRRSSENAARTMKSQMGLMPTYGIEMLPFFGKMSGGLIKKFITGGSIEFLTESLLQEYPQNVAEKVIKEGASFRDAPRYMSWSEDPEGKKVSLKHTMLQVPQTFLMGGGGAVKQGISEQEAISRGAKALASKMNLGEMTGAEIDMSIAQIVKDNGVEFAKAFIGAQFVAGAVDESAVKRMMEAADFASNVNPKIESMNLDEDHKFVAYQLLVQAERLRKNAEAESEPILKKTIESKLSNLQRQIDTMFSGGNAEYVKMSFQDGTTTVMTTDAFRVAMQQPGFAKELMSGVEVSAFGKESEAIQKEVASIMDVEIKKAESEARTAKQKEEFEANRESALQAKWKMAPYDFVTTPEHVVLTIERVESSAPTSDSQLSETSDWLYAERKRLIELKSDPKRDVPLEEIDFAIKGIETDLDAVEEYRNTMKESSGSSAIPTVELGRNKEGKSEPKQQNENAISKQRTETLGEQPVGKEGDGYANRENEDRVLSIVNPRYLARGGRKAALTEGYYTTNKDEAIAYADGKEENVAEAEIDESANVLVLVDGDYNSYEDNVENQKIFNEITGIDYSVEEFSNLNDQTGVKESLIEAGYDAVVGSTIDGMSTFVLNKNILNPLPRKTTPTRPASEVFQNPVDAYNAFDGANAQERDAFKEKHKGITARESVSVRDIIPTQATIIENDGGKLSDGRPTLYRFDGKVYVLDGHNRIAKDIDSGKTEIDADVIDFDAAQEAKTQGPGDVKSIAQRIRDKKIGGVSFADPLFGAIGISKTIYDNALELAARQVEKGTKIGTAIANAIRYVDEMMAGKKWDKGLFGRHLNDQFKMTVNGKEVEVKRDLSEETLEVVNGWYSPLEKTIKDTKADSLTAKEWLDRVRSKEGEDMWTGLRGMLEAKNPKDRVSKRELLNYLKDNRVDVVEVVKGGEVSEAEIDLFLNDEAGEGYTREQAREYLSNDEQNSQTKYSQYQLEGEKENYKEVLVTLPSKIKPYSVIDKRDNSTVKTFDKYSDAVDFIESSRFGDNYDVKEDKSTTFQSSHFDEPNILVHLRMNTRTDADGNKVLFLEEVQSDWGQKGKKEGFYSEKRLRELDDKVGRGEKLSKKEEQELNELDAIQQSGRQTTPTAPFVMDTNAWTKLGLKVALKEAVAQGVDKIAWTTGEQQNDRYSLEKIADELRYSKNSDGTYKIIAYKEGENVSENRNVKEKDLDSYFGKDVAQRIIDGVGEDIEGEKSLIGENLKVGGKGMKGFYGSIKEGTKGIVGSVAESLSGQKVEDVSIEGNPQPSISVTPEMVSAVKSGLPLFGTSNTLRDIADSIRRLKIHKRGGNTYAASPLTVAWDVALEIAALSVEASATVAEAIDAAMQSFRKSDWYKEASKRSRRKEERNLREQLLGGMSMSDIRAAQKEAMSNKHYTKAPIVRVFSKIRPGDIPFSVLEDYIEALKGLSASVPNYDGLTVLMGRVVDAVEKGKVSKANAKKAKAEETIATKASVVDAIDEIASRDLSSINSIIKAENDLDAIMSALYDIEYDDDKKPKESSTQILENEVSQLWMKAFKEKNKIQYQGKKEIDDMADNVLDIMSEVSAAGQHRRWSQPQQDLYYDLFSLLHQRGADAKAMLKKLPLSQLATLEAVVSNMMPITINNGANMTSSGEVDVARLSPIVDRLYSVSKDADAFIEDAEKIASKGSDDVISEFASRASANEVQRHKDLLGIKITERSKFLDTLTQLYETGMTAYNEELRAGLDHITKAKKDFGIKNNSQRRRIGVIAIYIRDYLDGKAEQGGGMRDYWKNVMYEVKDGKVKLDDNGNPKINTENMRNMDSVKDLADVISAASFAAGRAKRGAKATTFAIGKVVKDIESVRSSIPAELRVDGDPNGDIDPKKVWESYAANDGKALTKEERAFLESIVSYSESHLGYMQESANEARGLPFKWIPFYVRRTVKRGSVGNVSANPNATARRGSIRLASSTGKDATDMAATPVEYDIEKMFTHALEQTARDYHVGKTVRRANALLRRLSTSGFENASLLATSAAEYMSQMLTREFIRNVSPIDRAIGNLVKLWVMNTMANAVRTIREHAIAGTTLFLRTGRPVATVRAQIASKEKKGELLDLMHFLGSPLILKAITNKHMDMAGSEIRNPTLAEKYLRLSAASSEPMIIRSTWFPEFKDAFKKETGEDFDMSKFKNDPEYRYEYRSEMLSASTAANLAVYSIIGPALSGQRILNAQLIPLIGKSGRFSTQSPMVKQIMLFTGFSNRERQQLVNGLVGAAEGLASGDPETAAREASKTVGTAISVLAYGITGTMQFILSGYVMSSLFGDDDEKEKWAKEWRDFTSGKSAFDEVIRATAGLALSKYGAVSRGMATIAASILYNSTDDKEMKEYIRKSMKDNLYSEPISMSSNKYSSEPTIVELIGEMMASARAIARMVNMGSKFVSSVGELIEGEEDKPVDEQTLADRQDEKDVIDAVNVAYSAAVLALTVKGMPMFERATFDKIIDRLNKHPLTQKDIDDKNAIYNKMLFSEIEDSIEKKFPSQRSAGKDMPKTIGGGDRYGNDIIRKDDPKLQEIISDAVKKYRPSSSNKIILSDYELAEDSGEMVAKNVENMRVRLNAKRLGYVGGEEGAMSEDPVAYTDLLSEGKGSKKGIDGVAESLIPSSKSWMYKKKDQTSIYSMMLGMVDAGILSESITLEDFNEAIDKRKRFIDEMEKRIAKKKK